MKNEIIEEILVKIAKDIDITEEQFDQADKEYNAMGKWIDENTVDYKITIYPQGSFSLGTVVKPFDKEDEYDLDFVCEYKAYENEAEDLKSDIRAIITRYKECESIEEKRRCWQVTYSDNKKFHMDIIPAVNKNQYIDITDRISEDHYQFIGSNPQAYINWFKEKQKATYQRLRETMMFQADIKEIKEYHIKTPLQKAIQILKRHRDVMFVDDNNKRKPISIIITTIAATLYNHESTVSETIWNYINGIDEYLRTSFKNGKYVIKNPTYTGGDIENFAEKWVEHPERKEAFFEWVKQIKIDFNKEKLNKMNLTELGEHFKKVLGEKTSIRVFSEIAEDYKKNIVENNYKVDSKTGVISKSGDIGIKTAHHYGEISKKQPNNC